MFWVRKTPTAAAFNRMQHNSFKGMIWCAVKIWDYGKNICQSIKNMKKKAMSTVSSKELEVYWRKKA